MSDTATRLSARNYEIVLPLHGARLWGYFTRQGEAIGQLWFERLTDQTLALTDYDGVAYLPWSVIDALRANGIIVTEDFD